MYTTLKKRLQKLFRVLGFLLFAILCVGVLSSGHVLWHYPSKADTQRTCGVIFGAAVWRGDTPSHALADRTLSAAALYEDNRVSCLILSGGASTYGAHEVDVMKKVLLDENVPEEILVYDYNGNNTIATLTSLYLLDPQNSYVLISNDFHLGRIKLIAHQIGLDHFDLQAATYHFGRYPKEPYYFFREVIANVYYFLRLEKINVPKRIPTLPAS